MAKTSLQSFFVEIVISIVTRIKTNVLEKHFGPFEKTGRKIQVVFINALQTCSTRVETATVSLITKRFLAGSLSDKLGLYCMDGNYVGIVRVDS